MSYSKKSQHPLKISPLALPVPPEALGLEPGAQAFSMGNCRIIVGHSPKGWHLSISAQNRLPTWEEIKEARYQLVPGEITVAMLLPPLAEYVNIHSFTFHLWEVPSDTGK